MKWVGIFQVGIFQGEDFPWVGIFWVGIFPGGIFLEPKQPYSIVRRSASNLLVASWKSMSAFKIKVLFLSSRELSPWRRISVIYKSLLSNVLINVSYSIQEI